MEDHNKQPTNEGLNYDKQNGTTTDRETFMNSRRYKLVLLGDSQVGKTALMLRYTRGIYDDDRQIMSVGIEYYLQHWEKNGYILTFNIWDCACHKDYKRMMIRFIKNSTAILVSFDMSDYKTFDNLSKWLD